MTRHSQKNKNGVFFLISLVLFFLFFSLPFYYKYDGAWTPNVAKRLAKGNWAKVEDVFHVREAPLSIQPEKEARVCVCVCDANKPRCCRWQP